MWGEFKPSSGSRMLGFWNAFADIHGALYNLDGYEEPDIPAAGLLQDRENIQKYFDTALSRLGLKD